MASGVWGLGFGVWGLDFDRVCLDGLLEREWRMEVWGFACGGWVEVLGCGFGGGGGGLFCFVVLCFLLGLDWVGLSWPVVYRVIYIYISPPPQSTHTVSQLAS